MIAIFKTIARRSDSPMLNIGACRGGVNNALKIMETGAILTANEIQQSKGGARDSWRDKRYCFQHE